MNTYNLYNAEAQFKNLMLAENISRITIRNYLSDFRYYHGWYTNIFKGQDLVHDLSPNLLTQFKEYMINEVLPLKTINRRLSTLRKYCSLMRKAELISSFPESNISNLKMLKKTTNELKSNLLLNEFESFLSTQMTQKNIESELNNVKDLIKQLSHD